MKTKVLRGREKFTIILTILLSIGIIYSTSAFWTAQAAGTISGRVFQDFNGNGLYDTSGGTAANPTAIDRGITNIIVTAYDSAGMARGSTTTTAATGTYSLPATGTGPYRIEFTNLPAGYEASARSTDSVLGGSTTDSGTTIQFVNDVNTTNVNLAINRSLDFCQNNPNLVTTCFTGTVSGNTSDPVLVSFPYNSGTTSTTDSTGVTTGAHDLMIPQNTLGAILGLAYHRTSQKIFAGAFTKRHAGFRNNVKNTTKDDPTGEIFISNRTGTTGAAASLFVNLNSLFGSNIAGANPHDTANYGTDATAFDAVGKNSFGDIELSEDEQTLYAINLNDRKLYAIPLGSGTPTAPTNSSQVTVYNLASLMNPGTGTTGCPSDATTPTGEMNRNLRPGALKFKDGKIYVGLTCTAQSTNNASQLRIFVYELNPAGAGSATQVVNFPLNYPRGYASHSQAACAGQPATTCFPATWKPWISNPASLLTGPYGQNLYPQPWLLDIEFDERNFMILGINDRIGHQTGNDNAGANTGTVEGTSGGDILRLWKNSAAWTLESNGSDGTNTTVGANNTQGPGGGEFYYQDYYTLTGNATHDEITLGNLLVIPGFPDVLTSAFDPAPTGTVSGQNTYRAGGIIWLSNTTGARTRSYQLFSIDAPNTFGKASGIGDIEAMCNLAPIELGNRVWNDTNGNGIQDPGENGISGVTVRLYQGSTLIGTAVTDANGEYYFSSATGTNTTSAIYGLNILPKTDYQIRLDNAANYSIGGALNNLLLTRRDETIQAGFAEGSDSDALLVKDPSGSAAGTFAVIPVSTGDRGENNHNLDAGFTVSAIYCLGNRVWLDTNNDGRINSGEVGISGVALTLLDSANNPVDNPNIAGTQDYTISSDTNGYYRFDSLAAGNYKVRVNASNFTGTLLAGYQNTTGNVAADLDSTSTSGQNGEDGINPGVANSVRTNGILSNIINLGAPGEPTNEADVSAAGQGEIDAAANMTVDFGFYRACLDGTVWSDTNNNGLLGGGETGLGSVKVQVFSGTTEILVGPDGILGTADDAVGGMLTSIVSGSVGNYNFCGLAAGTYRIIVTPNGGTSSNDIATTANPDNNVDSDDNGFPDNTGNFTGKVISGVVTLTPGDAGASNNNTITNSTGSTSNPTLDFGFVLAPSAVKLDKFEAFTDGNGVRLEWSTGSENKNLGFNIYRDSNGQRELVNSTLIAGSAIRSNIELQASGDSYGWTDDSFVAVNPTYWLEDTDLDGTKTLHGPVVPTFKISFAKAAPNAKLLTDLVNLPHSSSEKVFAGKAKTTPTPGNIERQREIAGQDGVKISIKYDGWYRVSAEQLQNSGFDPNSNSDLWQLFAGAEEVPMQIYKDGSIEFFGRGIDTISSDTQVYYLVRGKTPGRRVSSSQETIAGEQQPTVSSFPVTVERKDRIIYISSVLNGDAENWYGDLVLKTAETKQSLNVQGISQTGQVHLSLNLQGLNNVTHLVNLRFNDFQLGTISYEGITNQTFEFDLPLSAIIEGENKLYLQSAGTGNDISMVDTIRLSYMREFKATEDKLRFIQPAGQQINVSGFSTGKINFYELVGGRAANIIETGGSLVDGSYVFTFAATNSDREILAMASGTHELPAAVERNNPSNLSSRRNSADFVIITPEIFRNQAEQLANLRRSQGLRTQVVFSEDIFDEFGFGSSSPEAVKQFLQTAQNNWQIKPRFALLFGDSSYDMRNYSGQEVRNLVPSKLIDTEVMETTSDTWLADFNGDGIEDIALGRLPAGNPVEADLMLGKLVKYDNQKARTEKNAVLISDRGFENYNNQLQAHLPNGVRFSRIDRSAMSDSDMNQAITAQTNQGPTVLAYNGHGASGLWASSNVFVASTALELRNEHLSFVMLLTCLNGYNGNVSYNSMAESFFKAENGGAYAVWASSAITRPDVQLEIGQIATAQLFGSGNKTRLGDILRGAKQNTDNADVRLTWSLLGDPTVYVK